MTPPRSATTDRRRIRLTTTLLAVALIVLAYLLAHVFVDSLQLNQGWGLPARSGPPMMIVAHRGDLDRLPEDTAEAILAAAATGVDGIEFDVHQAADGVWYVIHDSTLDRTTDGVGAIAELTSSQIDRVAVDGGLGFRGDHRGLRVPKLVDVLEGLQDFPGTLYVDLQHARGADAAALAGLLSGRRAVVLCRSTVDARAVKAIDPSIETLSRRGQVDDVNSLDGWLMEATGEATLGTVAGAGRPVTVFVDDSRFGGDEWPALRRAWSAGVVAFISKHPRRAMQLRGTLRLATMVP